MAKKKTGPSKSSAIRDVLKTNRKMMAKDVVSTLAAKGIKVNEGLVYAVKGYLKGRKGRTADLRESPRVGLVSTPKLSFKLRARSKPERD